ncbi:translocation and assembly module TamA [Methylomarinovum caldicuralii]|uniref:Translocation and assembly module subunit TamA n=1 Tax=Methylomarinovum caldicuralii TaxID=438856 RepID=A0AAU9CJ45_9GAMM|nr:autotransporter assembly complex family protein [Methylomarinovum caldicuralii]BCX81631.1 translocation and assembly module TamA [Methylomarinovum caldicuralii]
MRRFLLLLAFAACCAASPQPRIHIQGGTEALRENIRAHLNLSDQPCNLPPAGRQRLRKRIAKEVDAAARALGYYHARIEKLAFQRSGECWELLLQVDPGPRVHIAAVDLQIEGEAAEDPEFERLRRNLPLRPGDPLRHDRYEALKLTFQNLALRRGYFDARFRVHRLEVDPRSNRAFIRLVFDSGPRYRIGAIEIRQDILDPDFVRRYLNVKPGDPYEAERLALLHRRLSDSGYFTAVRVKTHPRPQPRPEVPVTVTLEPQKRRQYRFGLGFDTNTGPRLTFSYQDRYLNRRGHRWNSDLRLSFIDASLRAGYRIPLADPLREHLQLDAGLRRQNLDTFTSHQAALNAAYVHPRDRWNETLSLKLNYERSRTGGEDPVQSLLLLPQASWSRRQAKEVNGRITRGFKFDFTVQGGATLSGNAVQFGRLRLWGKYVWPLPWRARLVHRWEMGALKSTRFANVPASFRFFAGGDDSIRGYGYQRLGPRNAEGKVVGGRYLGVISWEYEQMVWGNWGVAAFFDAGNAYDGFSGLGRATRFGAGVGLRWFSPVGLLRLDLATPVIHDEADLRIHFTFGALL